MSGTAITRQRAGQDEDGRHTQDYYLTSHEPRWRIEQPRDTWCREDDNHRRPLRFAVNAAVAVPVLDQGPKSPVLSQPTVQPL